MSHLFGFRRNTLIADAKRTLILALPLIGAQLLQVGNGLVDAMVSGHLGREQLAAGGIGAGIWFFTSLLCIGLMAGLSPTLSKLIGQRRRNIVGATFRQGLWLACVTGLLAMALILTLAATLDHWSLQPELVPLIRSYIYGVCWSLPAFAIVMTSRNVCEATAVARPVLLVQLLGLLINIAADFTLGLGLFGFPRLGLFGIGLSTTLVMISTGCALLWFLRGKQYARYSLFANFDWPHWPTIKPMLLLSLPIYFGLLFEAGLFVATAIQMGMIGTLEAGAHNIAISASAICYMLPLGLSFALAARTGRVYGRGLTGAPLRLRVLSGVWLTLAMATFTVIVILLFRHPLTALFTRDPEVLAIASQLMVLAAIFQLSDGAQATLIGMLRGLQDTRVPMLLNAFSYWGIAFAVGYYCAHHLEMGAYGLWTGLILGLTVASVLQAARLRFRVNQLERQRVSLAQATA